MAFIRKGRVQIFHLKVQIRNSNFIFSGRFIWKENRKSNLSKLWPTICKEIIWFCFDDVDQFSPTHWLYSWSCLPENQSTGLGNRQYHFYENI